MRRYKQLYKHDPERGIYGDCYRTCLAMILGIDPEIIPHFMHPDEKLYGMDNAKLWLKENFKLGVNTVAYPGSLLLGDILSTIEKLSPNIPAMLLGRSPRANHAIVLKGGKIYFDPSQQVPEGKETCIIGPGDSDTGQFWWIETLVPLDYSNMLKGSGYASR